LGILRRSKGGGNCSGGVAWLSMRRLEKKTDIAAGEKARGGEDPGRSPLDGGGPAWLEKAVELEEDLIAFKPIKAIGWWKLMES